MEGSTVIAVEPSKCQTIYAKNQRQKSRGLKRRRIYDYCQIRSGESTTFLERFSRKLKALDRQMLVYVPSSQVIKAFTVIDLGTAAFLFCVTLLLNANLDTVDNGSPS